MADKKRFVSANMIIAVIVSVVLTVLFGIFMYNLKTAIDVSAQKERSQTKLEDTAVLLSDKQKDYDLQIETYNSIGTSKAKSAAMYIRDVGMNNVEQRDLQSLLTTFDAENIFVVNTKRELVMSAYPEVVDFNNNRYNQLFKAFTDGGTAVPFTINVDSLRSRWYGQIIDTSSMVVVKRNPKELYHSLENYNSLESTLDEVTVGSSGYVFAVSPDLYTIEYHPDLNVIGGDVVSLGLNNKSLADGFSGWVKFNGQRMYATTKYVSDQHILIACVPESDFASSRSYVVIIMVVVFVIFMAILLVFGRGVRIEALRHKDSFKIRKIFGLYFNSTAMNRLMSIALSCTFVIFGITFYVHSIVRLSAQAVVNQQIAENIKGNVEYNKEEASYLKNNFNSRYLSKCQTATFLIEHNPDYIDRNALQKLCGVLQVEAIYVLDENGKTKATSTIYSNFSLLDDTNSQSYEFKQILNGYEDYIIQQPMTDDLGEYSQYVGCALHDKNSNISGLVEIVIDPTELDEYLAPTKTESLLKTVKTGNNGFAFSIDKKTKQFTYYPDSSLIGTKAADVGIDNFSLKDDLTDFISINDTKFFVSSFESGSEYIYLAAPDSAINASRVLMSMYVAAACLAGSIVMALIMTISRKNEEISITEDSGDDDSYFTAVMPDGNVRRIRVASERWDGSATSWRSLSLEQRFMSVFKLIILACGICALVLFIGANNILPENSIIRYIINGSWERKFSIFSVTASILTFTAIYFVTMMVRRIFITFAKSTSSRGETIGRLLDGIMKYASVIIGIYYCLSIMGINTKTLLASAGIVSVVIGLGAQSLISDFLDGLFIVFESEFQVGDIVTVGTWRGIVLEIGFRTTKIEDVMSNNIKIFNNSQIKDIVNMTKKHSCAYCDVGIEYGESLERVENVLREELPRVGARIPSIKKGPFYKGVVALADSSVNIRIICECSERDRIQTERDMMREMKLIFDKHNINIPFPQVVVNQPPVFAQTTERDKAMAQEYVEKQKEESKDTFA